MGIKGALARCLIGLSLLAVSAPLRAQDDSDNVASTRRPEDRADTRDPGDPSERDQGLADRDATDDLERDGTDYDADDKPKPVKKSKLGARALDGDSDDIIDRDGVDDEDAPKRDRAGTVKKDKDATNKDVAKKEPAKKDTDKSAKDKSDKDKSAKDKSGAVSKSQQKPGGCVEVSYEARYAGVGYDHLVTLKSECKKAMKCVVRTNVNQEPASVTLPPRGEESVVMWRGSPSRAFTPDVSCD